MTRVDAEKMLSALETKTFFTPAEQYERDLLRQIVDAPDRISELSIKHYLAWKKKFMN